MNLGLILILLALIAAPIVVVLMVRENNKSIRKARMEANRSIVRHACWMDVSDWLIGFDFSAVIPKIDFEERAKKDLLALQTEMRVGFMVQRPFDIVKITVP